MATWAFACRYHLKDLVSRIEQTITLEDLHRALEQGDAYTDDMPAVSIALAAESLLRMLRQNSRQFLEFAVLAKDRLRYLSTPTATSGAKHYAEPVYAKACSHLPEDVVIV